MLNIDMDISRLVDLDDKLKAKADAALRVAAAGLSAMTRAHIAERVSRQLRSTKDAYIHSLRHKKLNADTWAVELVFEPKNPESKLARAIEDGMPEHEMIDDLLKSNKAKTAKDGSKYLSIPFKHNIAPTRVPEAGLSLQSTVKDFLKQQGVAWGKIEKHSDGTPKLGLLHSKLDQNTQPLKTKNGPYQGWGRIGAVRQGPTGIPFLQGIRVYQSLVKGPDGKGVMGSDGNPKVQRGIFTFRMVSSKMKGTGRWVHPGLRPRKFFEEAYRWALNEWETKISKQVIDSVLDGT